MGRPKMNKNRSRKRNYRSKVMKARFLALRRQRNNSNESKEQVVESCSAFGCTEQFKIGSNIRFFKFPKDEIRRDLWIRAVKRMNWSPSSTSVLCGKHFKTGKPSKRLNHPDYFPTIFGVGDSFTTQSHCTIVQTEKSSCIIYDSIEIQDKPLDPQSPSSFTDIREAQAEEPQYIISDQIEIEDFPIDPELSSSIAISETPTAGIKSKVLRLLTEIEQQTTEGVVIKKEVVDDELEQQTTEGVVIKKEVDESLIGDATEIVHESSRPKDDEISIPKPQLNQHRTYLHTSRKGEVDILKKLTLPSDQQKILKNYVTEKEEELSKLKKELQEAYEKISSLLIEKNAQQNNIADRITDRICLNAFKLRFFTGLNSAKDFQWLRNLLHNLDTTATGLSVSSQLLIVLMRLQLNLQYPDLADRFGMSTDAIRRICDSLIPHLKSKLKLVLEGLSPRNVSTQPTEHVSHSYTNTVFVKLYKTIQRYTESVTEHCTNVQCA